MGAERVRITVVDTGAGLQPELLGQLFQPFNRLGQEVGAEEGTGIGLVVSKRLVELMDGVIGVESTVGVGSAFWIELRRAHVVGINAELAQSPGTDGPMQSNGARPHTLLYVEDNPANLKLVEQLILRRPDMRLLSAGDAHVGMDVARRSLPDVILMDINLPGLNGFEALTLLSNDPLTSHIPVIALSASAMPRDVERGLSAGFFRYLTKPIRVPEFFTTLTEALDVTAERAPRTSASTDT
jgi:hypothetical protein